LVQSCPWAYCSQHNTSDDDDGGRRRRRLLSFGFSIQTVTISSLFSYGFRQFIFPLIEVTEKHWKRSFGHKDEILINAFGQVWMDGLAARQPRNGAVFAGLA
jgi:hypothetical protein